MDVKVIKENQYQIAWVPNVHSIIDLPGGKFHIVGKQTCKHCGHTEDAEFRTEKTDTVILESSLE